MEPAEISFASVYNFVINFKPEEIDDVINDFELKRQGYKFLYAVDTFDIVSHYLPYTDGGLFQNKNKNELSQKLICYDYFFSGNNEDGKAHDGVGTKRSGNKCIVVLNEYKIELLSAKNKILRQLKDVRNVYENLEFLKSDTLEFKQNSKEASDYFEKNFDVLLLLLIVSEKKDFIHKEFDNFLRHRLSIIKISTGSESDDAILNQIFNDSKHSELSMQLFDQFVENNKYDLVSIDKELERYIYLENTFRDVQAIDRVLHINEMLRQKDEKYLVLYLSSAPFKTKELFRNLLQLKSKEPNFENIRGECSINRNIFQCFLYEMLSNEFPKDEIDISKALYSLRKVSSALEKKPRKRPANPNLEWLAEDIATLEKLKVIFDNYSSSLDNHFYIKIYEKYRELYNSVSVDRQYGNKLKRDIDLLPIFSLIDTYINGREFKQKYFDFNFTIEQIKQAVEIADSVSKSHPIIPDVLFGRDIIKNSFHHLPYLLFLYEERPSPLLVGLHQFLNSLIDISYPEHPLLPELALQLKKAVSSLVDEQNDIYIICLQQIVISYINLITTKQRGKAFEKEKEIIETLEKQRKIFNHLRYDSNINASQTSLEIKFRPYAFTNEIDYILLWLYRRNERILDGIDLGKKLIHEYPEDPRYFHGLALCYISLAYTSIHNVVNFSPEAIDIRSDLKHAFTYLRMAKEKYENVMEKLASHSYSMIIIKNYMAVLNSMADISVRLFVMEVDKDFSRIEEARKFINIAKEISSFANLVYNEYPVFSATELEIEYYEAKEFFEAKRIGEAHQKIINALNRKSILQSNISSTPIDPHFLEFTEFIQELSIKIFAEIKRRK